MTSRPAVRFTAACLCVALLSACYTYVPIESPAPQTPVRVTVPIVNVARDQNRTPETYRIEGVVVSSGDSLVLATQRRTETGAFREVVRVDTVRVETRSLLAIDEKVYSQPRSIGLGVLLAAGTAGLVAGLLSVTTGVGGDGPGNGGEPTANQLRIDPIFAAVLKLIGN